MGYTLDPRFVRGDLFNPDGKWKYTVVLEYTGRSADYEDWDMVPLARQALARATASGYSGVVLTDVPPGWTLVVLEPYSKHSHPIVIKGDPAP